MVSSDVHKPFTDMYQMRVYKAGMGDGRETEEGHQSFISAIVKQYYNVLFIYIHDPFKKITPAARDFIIIL